MAPDLLQSIVFFKGTAASFKVVRSMALCAMFSVNIIANSGSCCGQGGGGALQGHLAGAEAEALAENPSTIHESTPGYQNRFSNSRVTVLELLPTKNHAVTMLSKPTKTTTADYARD